ncbi:hypothetical protein HPB47_019324 [Ixodes persulcatus]|uniref:Uncharacterized protein n=1 Tax=Ixodes persulcatus TaxID=34615 RepID=A0AC60QJA9_IXOPE|nr:hypothetical protein HPB47_019324 [Ixodes persulcatus]
MESRGAQQKPGDPTVSDQEALIMHVESHPWLYDTSRSNYRDSTKRECVGIYRATNGFLILGVTEAECKRRWWLIRDRYAKESKGTKGKSGAGREDVTQPTWDCDDLEPSATCSLLVNLEERGETPNAAQLTPPLKGPAASHQDLLPQAGRLSQANGAAPAATKRPASPEGPRPPAPKRRARSSTQHIRTREESELLRVLEQTSSAMANSCTRPHMDSCNPAIVSFALSISHELALVPQHLQASAKFEIHKIIYKFQQRGHFGECEH